MSVCPGMSRVIENSMVTENFLEFTSWEQKTDVVKTCTDEGSYQDKIRTQSFRGHTLKGFSLYFSFQALQALGKFVWNCFPDDGKMHVGRLVFSKSHSTSITHQWSGERAPSGDDWWPHVRAGYPDLTSVTLVLFLWFVEGAAFQLAAWLIFNFFLVFTSENMWRTCEVTITIKKEKI